MTDASNVRVETYRLTTASGRHVRMVTRVVYPDGAVIKFIDKLGKADAIRQANAALARRKALGDV